MLVVHFSLSFYSQNLVFPLKYLWVHVTRRKTHKELVCFSPDGSKLVSAPYPLCGCATCKSSFIYYLFIYVNRSAAPVYMRTCLFFPSGDLKNARYSPWNSKEQEQEY